MKSTLAITLRELDESRFVFGLALLTGLLPFGFLFAHPELDLGLFALIMAAAVGGALALMTGSGTIAGPLTDGSLSFYFTQPVSGMAIWVGKVLGAILMSLAASTLALLPTGLTGALRQFGAEIWFSGIICIVAIVFCSHAAGIILRARSPWLLLDLFGLTASLLLSFQLVRTYRPLMPLYASLVEDLTPILVLLASLATLAAIISGGLQTIAGRTESIRSHRVLSCTFWAILAAGIAASWAGCNWLTKPRLNELDWVGRIVAADTGPWALLDGFDEDRLPGYPVGRQFLLDTDSGRSYPLGSGGGLSALKHWTISADGTYLVGSSFRERGQSSPLLLIDLEASNPVMEETGWYLSGSSLLALDYDGSRVAILDSQLRLKIVDLRARRVLETWKLDRSVGFSGLRGNLVFLEPGILRATLIDSATDTKAVVFDIDLHSRETRVLRSISGRDVFLASGSSPVLVVEQDRGAGLLDILGVETDSSEESASSIDIWVDLPERFSFARSQGDSIAYAVKVGEVSELRFLGEQGRGPTVIPFEGARFSIFPGLRRGEVLVCPKACLSPQLGPLLRVDSSTGDKEWLDEGLRPLVPWDDFGWKDRISSGSISARLLLNADHDLVLLDTKGEVEKVLVKTKK